MKIASVTLAWVCLALLVLYMVSGLLVWAYFDPANHGALAALFAASAGTAILVGVTLELPELKGKTPTALRLSVLFTGAASGVMSAINWLADEVDHLWLRAVMVLPVVIILLVLMWFFQKVREEGEEDAGS